MAKYQFPFYISTSNFNHNCLIIFKKKEKFSKTEFINTQFLKTWVAEKSSLKYESRSFCFDFKKETKFIEISISNQSGFDKGKFLGNFEDYSKKGIKNRNIQINQN